MKQRKGLGLGAAVLAIALLTAAILPDDRALLDATKRGDVAAVKAALKEGADVNAALGDGLTALHLAAQEGNLEITKVLLGARANVEAKTRIGDYTPLHLAAGGAQELFGITPDLTTFGKIIGGGLPVGAFGGRADIMDRFDPTRPDHVQHSGTFAGNAATMAAGAAALELLTSAEIARINALGDRLRSGIKAVLDEAEVPARVTGLGSLVGIHLTDRPAMHWLHLATLNHGLFMRAEGSCFLSTAMRDDAIAETVSAFRMALADANPTPPTGSSS